MERCVQHNVLPLFIRVQGPVIQTSFFPGLFVGISIEKPEKWAEIFSKEYIISFLNRKFGVVLKYIFFFT